uniref:DUF4351 domain-containing protein n=1 Tax=Candidatus Methanogaster sp. ANME-2c ERB4 TaxID=2759911 RepID=A0A7G9Y3Z3_9EURY|nr:hypothetical protein EABBNKNM_00018 [Methanosarcinales archaeon ANME-2c ERB4]QNO42727.1 hypothetical protein APGODIHH_00016 [Methanosarcinales archaeon ANME-2c ERB4]
MFIHQNEVIRITGTQIENIRDRAHPCPPTPHLIKCFYMVEDAIKQKQLGVNSYVCTWIFAELKYPKEMVKAVINEDLIQQSTFYKETLKKGITIGMEKSIHSVLKTRFGSASYRLSERIHNLRERNSALPDELINLAVTAKDLGEFERKMDRMMWA